MQELQNKVLEKAKELLASGAVNKVVAWKKGEFAYDPSPATFDSAESLSELVYDDYCGANLSKYLIEVAKGDGKVAVFLKPCDSYSFNELVKEHRVDRDKVYVVGVECRGKLDNYKLEQKGISGVTSENYDGEDVKFTTIYGDAIAKRAEVLLDKCATCKGKKHVVADETIIVYNEPEIKNDRFSKVRELESMTADERY